MSPGAVAASERARGFSSEPRGAGRGTTGVHRERRAESAGAKGELAVRKASYPVILPAVPSRDQSR